MERQHVKQESSSVKLQIWHGIQGEWQCRVSTEDGEQFIQLNDQAALSAYIAHQIDRFVSEYERLESA